MLRTRLWMGTLLIGLAVLLLLEDRWFAPWYPVLLVCYLGASLAATREFLDLLPEAVRPAEALTLGFVCVLVGFNWWSAFLMTRDAPPGLGTWDLIGACVLVGTGAAFVYEMWRFRGPDRITERIALTAFVLIYLGVLPSFLAQIRWLPRIDTTAALALTVFVPKGNDIGAYFVGKFLTGRLLGRHHMTPLLSPNKTWQGAVGGMVASVTVAVGINAAWPVVPGGWAGAVGFGLTVGTAGVLGDLAESLLKRDLQTKDASASVPGFGGVLDVIDSLLFAAPIAYLWFWWAARQAV
ncbi:MAG: phosphatidate cytidylyltransferase [Zavarzinella sp.]|nr:phosphatidate cytidylyltransferase [Zavarzinella sp.]